MKISKMLNPWSWSEGADDEYTKHLQEAYNRGANDGHALGFAQGVLSGRMEIIGELEFQFGESRVMLDAEEVKKVKTRQVH